MIAKKFILRLLYLVLVIPLFSGCSFSSPLCCSRPDRNQIVVSGVKIQKGDPVKITFTPLDNIKVKPQYSFTIFGDGVSENEGGIAVKLYPYGSSSEIIGIERKFKFELYVLDKLVLQKNITIKTEKNHDKKPWQLKVEELEVKK